MAWREALKKPVARPTAPKPKFQSNDDDWDTDVTYENRTDEKSQRFGSTAVPGSGRIDHVDFKSIQEKVRNADNTVKQVYQETNPNRGYGGKYGTDKVMDKSAADYTYRADIQKHSSQTDCKKGFGGVYGVDTHAKDKSAVGFDYRAEVEKHPSQTDFSKGFGGKFGTDSNAQDKSAVGYSHREPVEKHSSQTDFSKGFGGKFGTDSHAQDKSAHGFTHREPVEKHSSQKDYNVGFGGKYGVQKEEPSRLPKSISPTSEQKSPEKTAAPVGSSIGVGNIRARFENMKKEQEEEAARRVAEERNKRAGNDCQSTTNGHNKVQHEQVPSAPIQTYRPPSPPAISPQTYQPPSSPPAVSAHVSDSNIYQNFNNGNGNRQSFESEQTPEQAPRIVGGIDVSTLLRQRKTSSSSSKNDDNDDEWADDRNSYNYQTEQRNPSPTSVVSSSNNNGNHVNEGIRCIAHYSYQKTEEDELGFEENDIITNVQKMHDEWWFGKIGQRSGLFPANYVEEIQ